MCPLWDTQKIVTWKLTTYFKMKFYALSGYVGEIVEKIQSFEISSIFWWYLCFFFEIFPFEANFDRHKRFSPNFFFVCWKVWLFSREKHRLQGGDSLSRFSVILILRKKVVFSNLGVTLTLWQTMSGNFFFQFFSRLCLFGPISVCMQKIEGECFF